MCFGEKPQGRERMVLRVKMLQILIAVLGSRLV